MSHTLTIARRELASMFLSPIGYVVLGVFAALVSLFHVAVFFRDGEVADTDMLFFYIVMPLLVLLLPAISMRLISEEFGRGTIETLMTSPINDLQLVMGKFLGALGFLVILLATLAIPIGLLEYSAEPDYGPILSGLLGLFLAGSMLLAIGILASSLTQNQVIAFVLALFITVPLALIGLLAVRMNDFDIPRWVRKAVYYLSIFHHFDNFNRGYFSLANVVFFVSLTVMFLFITVQVVESRRWR